MAKFIIEISDEQIRDLSDANKLSEKFNNKGGLIKAMAALVSASLIKKRIEEGESEFFISREMMTSNEGLELFDSQVINTLVLATRPREKEEDGTAL